MKTLKFSSDLVLLVLSGEKTSTWRLFDDKNLQVGDLLRLVDSATKDEFAKAQIVSIREKALGKINDEDFLGHERFENKEKMLDAYRSYYGDAVNENTIVKMINFKIV